MANLDGDPPDPISFRTEVYAAGTTFPAKAQPWAELNYAVSGFAEFHIAGRRYLSPPHYAIWIPPDVEHEARTPCESRYCSVYVHRDLCADLPMAPCTLAISPVMKVILSDFAGRSVTIPRTDPDRRLAAVLLDQMHGAERRESYLPLSRDPQLQPILTALQADPGSQKSAAEWGRLVGLSERTLTRRFQQSLGMSLQEWRQRLRLVAAISMLEQKQPIKVIAARLGYQSASAFNVMFRQLTGATPSHLRETLSR